LQSVWPKLAQEPVESIYTIGRQRISPATAGTIRPDEDGRFNTVKMLGHVLLRDVECIPMVTCGAWGISLHTQDFPTARLSKRAYD